MVVRDPDGIGIEVEQPWHEAAHHEARPRERLVHRRRLVEPPHDRLEVLDREGERVDAAIPPDDVERVAGVDVARPARSVPDEDAAPPRRRRAAARPARGSHVRRTGAPSRSWPVAVRYRGGIVEVTARLHDQHPHRSRAVDDPAMRRRGRHDDVVARPRPRGVRRPTRARPRPRQRTRPRRRRRCGTARSTGWRAPSRRVTSALPSSDRRPVTGSPASPKLPRRRCKGRRALFGAGQSRGITTDSALRIALGEKRW